MAIAEAGLIAAISSELFLSKHWWSLPHVLVTEDIKTKSHNHCTWNSTIWWRRQTCKWTIPRSHSNCCYFSKTGGKPPLAFPDAPIPLWTEFLPLLPSWLESKCFSHVGSSCSWNPWAWGSWYNAVLDIAIGAPLCQLSCCFCCPWIVVFEKSQALSALM